MMISPEQYIDGLEWRYACKKFGSYILKFGKNFLRIVSFLERIYLV